MAIYSGIQPQQYGALSANPDVPLSQGRIAEGTQSQAPFAQPAQPATQNATTAALPSWAQQNINQFATDEWTQRKASQNFANYAQLYGGQSAATWNPWVAKNQAKLGSGFDLNKYNLFLGNDKVAAGKKFGVNEQSLQAYQQDIMRNPFTGEVTGYGSMDYNPFSKALTKKSLIDTYNPYQNKEAQVAGFDPYGNMNTNMIDPTKVVGQLQQTMAPEYENYLKLRNEQPWSEFNEGNLTQDDLVRDLVTASVPNYNWSAIWLNNEHPTQHYNKDYYRHAYDLVASQLGINQQQQNLAYENYAQQQQRDYENFKRTGKFSL